jgi:hypothetical protein
MKMFTGKRQIILAVSILVLGAAIFLNWKYDNTLGEADYVDNQNVKVSAPNEAYFDSARTARDQTDTQAVNLLNTLVSNTSLTAAEKQSDKSDITAINNNAANEKELEGLITKKDFADCVAIINNGVVNVVVMPKTGNTLSASDTEQIETIITQQTHISADNIFILTPPNG